MLIPIYKSIQRLKRETTPPLPTKKKKKDPTKIPNLSVMCLTKKKR